MRVGFTLLGGKNWTGGYNYLLNLLTVLTTIESQGIRPVLFVGEDMDAEDLIPFRKLQGLEIVQSNIFDQNRKHTRLLRALTLGADLAAQRMLIENRIDVVFESATFYGRKFKVPCVAWMPDFQHRHLRNLFGFLAYWKRELGYRLQIKSGRLIMLSSNAARKDCEQFYPLSIGKTSVVRFAVRTSLEDIAIDPESVRGKYRLPERYFYMPNQFWKHKNHKLIIDALKLLKKQGVHVCVAASGLANDMRFPGYYQSLEDEVRECDLEDDFRFIGKVPYSHLLALMKGAVAVVNASLFEGWSTTVEEAKSLGCPLVLSDLEVHREQAPDRAWYFNPYSAEDAACVLREADMQLKAESGGAHSGGHEGQLQERLIRFAREFTVLTMKARDRHKISHIASGNT